ncbi:DUF4192 family protein [Nocardia sp. NPDC050793]|uniref:DUF4192 family protein n=1 Tax=Nocardia sp. NPDC050793 TaxID=3155159 RepID=UPI0033C9C6F7
MPSIHAPESLITATLTSLPQLPPRSLLLFALRETGCSSAPYRIDALYSHDLYAADGQLATAAILEAAQHVYASWRPDAVAVIIIDEPAPHRPVPIPDHRELATLLGERLAETNTSLVGAWTITATEPGSSWVSLLDDQSGVLTSPPPDPAAAPQPGSVVGSGPAPDAVDGTAPRSAPGRDPNVFADDLDQALAPVRSRLRLVLALAHAVNAGVELRIEVLAELAEALEDPVVRDALYAFAVGPNGPIAVKLWTLLMRELPIRRRCLPAMLAALTHYTSGESARTAAATIQTALTERPDDPTLQTLATAITAAVPAELLRTVAHGGRCTAADLGIDIA